MNLEEKVIDTDVLSSDHLSYVRCNFCNTVLAVRIPFKRMLDTVTVKCGHCNNLSFLSTRPPNLGMNFLDIDHHLSLQRPRRNTDFHLLTIGRRYSASKRPILRYHTEKLLALQLRIGLGTFQTRVLDLEAARINAGIDDQGIDVQRKSEA
ncbi:hypothetical protein Peur_017814 [Populus x canadensis]